MQECLSIVERGDSFWFMPSRCESADYSFLLTKEPSCFNSVKSIDIIDRDNDGTTDGVEADWLKTFGKLKVIKRSPYTQGLLEYFDRSWGRVKNTLYVYSTPTAPLDLKVKQGDVVRKGAELFTCRTDKGIRTFRAEVDGTIEYLDNGDGLLLKLKKGFGFADFISELKRTVLTDLVP